MKDRSQTIINVCLAIFVATTIYNTNQLNDRIDTLETQSFSKWDADQVEYIQRNQDAIDVLKKMVDLNAFSVQFLLEGVEDKED